MNLLIHAAAWAYVHTIDPIVHRWRRLQCARDGRAVRWTLADGVSQDATKANSGMNP